MVNAVEASSLADTMPMTLPCSAKFFSGFAPRNVFARLSQCAGGGGVVREILGMAQAFIHETENFFLLLPGQLLDFRNDFGCAHIKILRLNPGFARGNFNARWRFC